MSFVRLLILLGATLPAQTTSAPASPRELDDLIVQLGAPREAVRRSATEAIVALGESTYGPLREAFARTSQFEVKRRIQQVVEQIYLQTRFGPPSAFLGIQLQAIAPPASKPGEDPDIIYILVSEVIPGTAAEAAGIKRDDVIMRLNGEPIRTLEGRLPSLQDWIRKQKPGASCALQIRRGGTIMDKEVILRGRPIRAMQVSDAAEIERVRQALQSFSDWWRTEFDPQRTLDVSSPSADDPNWRLKPDGKLR